MTDEADAPSGPVLNANDLGSATWRKLAEHMEAKLAKLRVQNDSMKLDAGATAVVRGRIAALKDLLALANPGPAIVADEEQPE